MSLLNMFKRTDINDGVDEFRNTPNAVLLDVRTKEEYKDGHIEGSINIPLQKQGVCLNRKLLFSFLIINEVHAL